MYVKQIFSFVFSNDIDKVFTGLFNQKVAEKAEIIGNLINQTPAKGAGTYVEFLKSKRLNLIMEPYDSVIFPNAKTITVKLTSLNNKVVTSNLYLRHNLYMNSSDNSTFTTFEIASDEEDNPFLNEYVDNISIKVLYNYFNNISKYLDFWKKRVITIESITMNRPLHQIVNYMNDFKRVLELVRYGTVEEDEDKQNYRIINKTTGTDVSLSIMKMIVEKDKAVIVSEKRHHGIKSILLFTMIQLSPVSCFVSIENNMKFQAKGEYLLFLSELYQQWLKSLKKNIEEERICCYEE